MLDNDRAAVVASPLDQGVDSRKPCAQDCVLHSDGAAIRVP